LKKGGGWSGKCVLFLKFLVGTLQNFCLYQSIIDWWVKVKNYYSIFLCQYSGFDWAIYLALLISVCCAMVEAVSQCPVTVEAKVCSQVEFVVDRVAAGHVFLQLFWFSPVIIILWMLHTHISSTCSTHYIILAVDSTGEQCPFLYL
jgi:hypothetical protein